MYGIFDDIDEVISERERKDFATKYKQAADSIENLIYRRQLYRPKTILAYVIL